MAISGLSEENPAEAVATILNDMEALGKRLRELIAAQPPHDLLGFIHSQSILNAMFRMDLPDDEEPNKNSPDDTNDTQFLLEYVHATLASTAPQDYSPLDLAAYNEIFECAKKLRDQAHLYAIISSGEPNEGAQDQYPMEFEYHSKSAWITLRGNRYPVLEGEFFAFVLKPHNDILNEVYGIGAAEIAAGFQKMANAIRSGYAEAVDEIEEKIDAATVFSTVQGLTFEAGSSIWAEENKEDMKAAAFAADDFLRGGVFNVSRHTTLTPALLADLAFQRGEEKDFFDEGVFSGTPFRTLPARKKPLIKLGNDYYAIDYYFPRDTAYRALLLNLLQRKKEYEKDFQNRQKTLSESAFFTIFCDQLKGAIIHQEVYYKDVVTNEWVENDALILIDDVLILVEAKSGAAATIASPATDFPRHQRAVQDLVIKAYTQCARFFDYLASSGQVAIFKRIGGKFIKCGDIKISSYRVMLPIGLTVEAFTPFSAFCKELPGVAPILGKHPFISMSIDDLFVLKRFLPTIGALAHYLEVRQALAGARGVYLFDELDHLGAYIQRNRFDVEVINLKAKNQKVDSFAFDGMSDVVNHYFEGYGWEKRPVPTRDFPTEVIEVLRALDGTRAPGWVAAESLIRNYDETSFINMAAQLTICKFNVKNLLHQQFALIGPEPLLVFFIQADISADPILLKTKASAMALVSGTPDLLCVMLRASKSGDILNAERIHFNFPRERTPANVHIFEEAQQMARYQRKIDLGKPAPAVRANKIGRNEPCWCGSGAKFKKCHGP